MESAVESGDVLRPSAADASVRLAAGADAQAVCGVHVRAVRAAWADLLDPQALAALSVEAVLPAWQAATTFAPTARHAVLVACSGATVVGFAVTRPATEPDTGPDVGELAALHVDPMHQRAGHGSRLLSAAVALLRDAGTTGLVAWCPEGDGARSAFLTSAGMVADGARRSYPTSDGRLVGEVRLTASLTG